MLKFEGLAKVGDRIRSYDFMGNKEAYIEGKVVAKGSIYHPTEKYYMYEAYSIEIDVDAAEFGRKGDIGYVPFETGFMEYDDRVVLVEAV